MKLYISGYAQHGKDTAAKLIRSFTGMTFESSSWFCCKLFIYNTLKWRMEYSDLLECFNDRFNHRQEWHELIRDFNKGDETRLSRAIFSKHDIYVGVRAKEEVIACREAGIVDLMLWIDASERVLIEDDSSINICKGHADVIIENNGTIVEFSIKIKRFCSILKG